MNAPTDLLSTAPLKTHPDYLVAQLAHYARYHRSRRNILTHCVGVPLIVLSLVVALDFSLGLSVDGINVSAAVIAIALTFFYYGKMGFKPSLVMLVYFGINLFLADTLIAMVKREGPFLAAYGQWLLFVGLFVVGWIWQFIGHYFEGKKPAFFDDIRGLLAGPLFVLAEGAFMLGWAKELQRILEDIAGKTHG